jgi:hypothetical protein
LSRNPDHLAVFFIVACGFSWLAVTPAILFGGPIELIALPASDRRWRR